MSTVTHAMSARHRPRGAGRVPVGLLRRRVETSDASKGTGTLCVVAEAAARPMGDLMERPH